MKKLILAGLAVLLALSVITCMDGEIAGGDEFANYEVDSKGNLSSVTLNLGGGGPTRNASRSLFDAMAKATYDYFEAVFYAVTDLGSDSAIGGTLTAADEYQVVRASWDFGGSGVIAGVHRTAAGVSYGSADVSAITTANFATTGAAVLFVGNRDSSNLLAVGLLSHVDGQLGAIVKDTSRTITFTVNSLQAGLAYNSIPSADLDTLTFHQNLADIAGEEFTGLKLTNADVTTGNYTFSFKDSPADSANRFAGIKIREANPKFTPRGINYLIGTKLIKALGTKTIDTGVSQFTLAKDSSIPGTGQVPFTFTTADSDGFLSFTYDIPVYAITDEAGADDSEYYPWRIRPGQGTYISHLDNNTQTALGGSILLIIGTVGPVHLEEDLLIITN